MNTDTLKEVVKVDDVFSPMSPIKQKDFFRGRISQLEHVMNAINTKGQHVILHGERGVGKTSLANIMCYSYTELYTVKVTCSRSDTFRDLWCRSFKTLNKSKTTKDEPLDAVYAEIINSELSGLTSLKNVSPSDIEYILKEIDQKNFLFIFDEFDNITDKNVRSSFADLIKSLSDNVNNSTILLVGIGDNVEELIGTHRSLERCLKQVKMPRMNDTEAGEIIKKGLSKLEITILNPIERQIIEFSSGFPHYIHLLCKYGATEILQNNKTEFNEAYLNIAIKKGIDNTNQSLRSSYQKATTDARNNPRWEKILYACANSKSDEYNCFSLGDVLDEYNKLVKTPVKRDNIRYYFNQLCAKDRGEILKKMGSSSKTKYRFINPMMRAYVKLKMKNDNVQNK